MPAHRQGRRRPLCAAGRSESEHQARDRRRRPRFRHEDAGHRCGKTARPYVTHCDYDQARDILEHVYATRSSRRGAPRPPATSSCSTSALSCGASRAATASMLPASPTSRRLQRRRGLPDPRRVPWLRPAALPDRRSVREGERLCRVGRQQSPGHPVPAGEGDRRHCQSARLLGLVGLYGSNYLTRNAPQIVAVKRMLDRLAQPRAAN